MLTSCAVKREADALQIPTLQPETLRAPDAINELLSTAPDVLVVVAYGELLRRNVLTLATHGCVNVHPSLLPRFRGAAPIPAAILVGDIMTGVSIIKLERRLDAGPIIVQRDCAVDPRDTTGSLTSRLADLASDILPVAVLRYVSGEIEPVPQDESYASYTREWTSSDARIDWTLPAIMIDRLVRASDPWPIAWSTLEGQRVRVLKAEVGDGAPGGLPPGTVEVTARAARVATGDGWLTLELVQPGGKRPMSAADWARGLRLMSTRFDPTDGESRSLMRTSSVIRKTD